MGQSNFSKSLLNMVSSFSKTPKVLSKNVFIPRVFLDVLRTEEEAIQRKQLGINGSLSKNFDNVEILITLIKSRLLDIKNIISDMKNDMDRYSIKIDELDEKKNNKIMFSAYSDNYTNTKDVQNPILKKSLEVNTNQVEGIIADEDSGIEFTEHVENGISYIKINLEDSKIDGLKFVSDSSVKINWNPNIKAYEVEQNDIFRYDSSEAEDNIIINHNLSSRALDVKVFRYDPADIDLKYPIMVGMEYPSDNQIRLYLTNKQYVSVLISRI